MSLSSYKLASNDKHIELMSYLAHRKAASPSAIKLPPSFLALISSYLLFCIVALASTLTIATNVYAEDKTSEEWHYTLRPGDKLQTVSKNLLARKYTWTDLIRHNKIENVSSLAPGSIIKVPMHWLKHQPKPATVKSVAGSAQVKRASKTKFKVLKEGAKIRVGDEIATRDGNVLIEFADGSTIRLDAHSNLIFNKLSHFGKTGMVDTRLRLKKGSLSTEVTPLVKGSRYEITTPSAVAAVRGTEFRIEASAKETKIEVVEGEVEFKGPHGAAMVTAGNGAKIRKGVTAIEQNKLPEAPEPLFAGKDIEDLPAKLKWKNKDSAEQYRVQVTDADNKDRLIKNSKLNKPELDLNHIENGNYDISMRAIDKEGFEGIDAKTPVTIDIASEKPSLLAPLDKSILDTAYPSFAWKFSDASLSDDEANQTLSKLEIAKDENFNLLVTSYDFDSKTELKVREQLLPGSYYWRVSALADDADISHSDIRKFAIRGKLAPVKILSVNYVDSQVGLFWNKIDNTRGYILQVSDSKSFENILKEQTIGKARAHLRLNPGKKYYARVKGIGNELFTAEYGPIKELFIEEQ